MSKPRSDLLSKNVDVDEEEEDMDTEDEEDDDLASVDSNNTEEEDEDEDDDDDVVVEDEDEDEVVDDEYDDTDTTKIERNIEGAEKDEDNELNENNLDDLLEVTPPPPPTRAKKPRRKKLQVKPKSMEEEEEDNDTYLQKFDKNIRMKIIDECHPELKAKDYDIVINLTHIFRDKKTGTIVDPNHKTLPFVTKYEKARILGERANQIENGSPIFIKILPDVIDSYLIALEEYKQKKIPFIIQRPLPHGECEYWKLSDLEII
jgi:DNA-directed RNA polymerase subunit K/omega